MHNEIDIGIIISLLLFVAKAWWLKRDHSNEAVMVAAGRRLHYFGADKTVSDPLNGNSTRARDNEYPYTYVDFDLKVAGS